LNRVSTRDGRANRKDSCDFASTHHRFHACALQSDLDQRFWEACQGSDYCDAWKTNGKETSTDPPDGAGKRHRAISDLMQLATSASPSVSCSTSTPDTVPACVIVQWMTTLPERFGLRFSARS